MENPLKIRFFLKYIYINKVLFNIFFAISGNYAFVKEPLGKVPIDLYEKIL